MVCTCIIEIQILQKNYSSFTHTLLTSRAYCIENYVILAKTTFRILVHYLISALVFCTFVLLYLHAYSYWHIAFWENVVRPNKENDETFKLALCCACLEKYTNPKH